MGGGLRCGWRAGDNHEYPAQVISLSLGGGDTCSAEMQSAVNAAIAKGAVDRCGHG